MPLSSMSFETLSDLLELRISTFMVTNPKEALQLAALHHCKQELLQSQAESPVSASLTGSFSSPEARKLRLPRRLTREIQRIRRSASA